MENNSIADFNWDIYEDGFVGGNRLIPNSKIKGTDNNTKCFSREDYAQKLFDKYNNLSPEPIQKDLKPGDCVKITDIFNVTETAFDIEISGGLTLSIDLNREKKFVHILGFDKPEELTPKLISRSYVKQLLEEDLKAYVIESSPSIKVSLWQGHLISAKQEFLEQINNPTNAYTCKIVKANRGGFFVEVQGVDAFMPGSLAAPNKIMDFESYVGKEIIVMIEDYLPEMNSFIVSHKKYIAHILPHKLAELDTTKLYTGNITGTSKYGIFIEFEDYLTGLLHVTKMSDETKVAFKNREFSPGDSIDFYIGEITKDNRVILTEEDPKEKLEKIQKFIFEFNDKEVDASVAAVLNFGMLVNIGDITGLIPNKEFKKNKVSIKKYESGDNISVKFDEYADGRLVFKLP